MKRKQEVAVAWAVASVCVLAQYPASVWDGVYSAEQAKRGAALYSNECASCHGATLEGRGQAPELSGEEFTAKWDGTTVADLFERIQSSMPADRPGRLSADQTAAVIAFILCVNKFPAAAELPGDPARLRQIRFEAARPK